MCNEDSAEFLLNKWSFKEQIFSTLGLGSELWDKFVIKPKQILNL